MCTEVDKILKEIKKIKDMSCPNETKTEKLKEFFQSYKDDKVKNRILEITETPKFSKDIMDILYTGDEIATAENLLTSYSDIPWGDYTIRHYAGSDPNNWKDQKVKSCLTLSVENFFSTDNASDGRNSGHTNKKDWWEFGNVGDTFYCLFYQGKPVTNTRPPFLDNCTHYIEWGLDAFNECWASTDWLDPDAPTLPAYSGDIKNILLSYFSSKGNSMVVKKCYLPNPNSFFGNYNNFEIKKHGSMVFNINQIHVNPDRRII